MTWPRPRCRGGAPSPFALRKRPHQKQILTTATTINTPITIDHEALFNTIDGELQERLKTGDLDREGAASSMLGEEPFGDTRVAVHLDALKLVDV